MPSDPSGRDYVLLKAQADAVMWEQVADEYRQAIERAIIELRGTTAEGGDAQAILTQAIGKAA